MEDRFSKIFEYLLKVEGGYSNDKYDSGGKTKYGIIEKEARVYGYKGDMRDLDLPFARNVYDKKYYHGNRLNEVNDDRIALSICDWIVNSGTWGAKKAQQALNIINGSDLATDGKIGNKEYKDGKEVSVENKVPTRGYANGVYYVDSKPANWWYDDGEAWYFFQNGNKLTGYGKDNAGTHYFVNGKYANWWYNDGKDWYFFQKRK